jgi:hypothetical protein
MTISPGLRTLLLTTHITCSIGWLGAVVVFLALSLLGLTSQNAQIARGVYLVMEPTALLVLVPLAFASLLTGIIQSLGTTWGLFQHYWVLYKFVFTAVATAVLLIYMGTFRQMAMRAADPNVHLAAVRNPSPVLHSTLALLVLLLATVLALYKPFGMTPYGQRKLRERRAHERRMRTSLTDLPSPDGAVAVRWTRYVLLALVAVILALLALHVAGGGMGGH